MKQIKMLLLVLSSIIFLAGCELALIGAGAGLGVGAYRYVEGSVARTYPFNFQSAWDTTNKAMENLFMSVSNSVNEGVKGTITAVQKDGTKIEVVLNDKGNSVTDISVRVGFWGDKKNAERLHEEIKNIAGIK